MDVWKAAMDFAAEIYRITRQLPKKLPGFAN
jgi:hypothetical protein